MKPANDQTEISYRLVDHPEWGIALKKYVRGAPARCPLSRPVTLTSASRPNRTFATMSQAAQALGVVQVNSVLERGGRCKGYKVRQATKAEALSLPRVTDHTTSITGPTATAVRESTKATPVDKTPAPFKLTVQPDLQAGDMVVSVVNDATEETELVRGRTYVLTAGPVSRGDDWFFDIANNELRWVSNFRPWTPADNTMYQTPHPRVVTPDDLMGIMELCDAVTFHDNDNHLAVTGIRKDKVNQALKDLAVAEAKALGINLSLD